MLIFRFCIICEHRNCIWICIRRQPNWNCGGCSCLAPFEVVRSHTLANTIKSNIRVCIGRRDQYTSKFIAALLPKIELWHKIKERIERIYENGDGLHYHVILWILNFTSNKKNFRLKHVIQWKNGLIWSSKIWNLFQSMSCCYVSYIGKMVYIEIVRNGCS